MNAVAEHVEQGAVAQAPTPATLVQMAITQNADLDRLQQLMEMQMRWDAAEARKSFVQAMAEFKTKPVEILKAKHVHYESSKGAVDYDHAELSDVCGALVPALAEVGIAHRWDVAQEDGQIVVTTTLTHREGHSESITLRGPRDDSGGKNSIQGIGSTLTYLQRYGLLSITGTSTKAIRGGEIKDDDGIKSEDKHVEYLSEGQVDTVDTLCKGIGPHQLKAVLDAYKVKDLSQIPASYYRSIVDRLEAKRKGEVK